MAEILPKFHLRLADVQAASVPLLATCFTCRHVSAVDVSMLMARHGEHAWVKIVEDKLVCSKCGGRGNTLAADWGASKS